MQPSQAPFNNGLNAFILEICGRLMPNGFDTSDTAPSTYRTLRAHYKRTGRVLVSNEFSESTIYGDARVNFAFRAWHDWCHLHGRFPFTLAGEEAACERQCEHIDLFGFWLSPTSRYECKRLVRAEVIGQARYFEAHGEFPKNQRAFVRAYLRNQAKAIQATF